jgi:hypothetical protein
MSMKNSNDNIGNWTRDVPVCSAVPQPTAPPRAPYRSKRDQILHLYKTTGKIRGLYILIFVFLDNMRMISTSILDWMIVEIAEFNLLRYLICSLDKTDFPICVAELCQGCNACAPFFIT